MGATNQRIAELHNIRLCGRPCPRKNPTHNIISRMFIAIAAYLKLIISSYKEASLASGMFHVSGCYY